MNRPLEGFCSNPICENEAIVVIPVTGAERRPLCGACEVAYQMGLQHGRMEQKVELEALVKALKTLKRRMTRRK